MPKCDRYMVQLVTVRSWTTGVPVRIHLRREGTGCLSSVAVAGVIVPPNTEQPV